MSKQTALPDNFDRGDDVKVGSERSFGLVFATVCGLAAAYGFWHGRASAWGWLIAGSAFAAFALLRPGVLKPLNLLWFKFGLLLHRVISPVILGLMFFLAFAPLGLLMRLLGKRPLNLSFDAKARSYWIHRKPPGPAPGSFNNQF